MRATELHDLELSSRITRFIRGLEGADIGRLIDMLQPVGEVGIFGGMPRDFARAGGSAAFDSDVDVVVDAPADALDEVLHPMGAERNRFGGYRLRHGRFDFDIWALERTWAVSTGHVAARSLTDLVKTTFFDCDAVVYHCCSATISRSNSFWSNLHRGVVDINLEANPHQVGTLARTLRILFDWQQDLSPKLAEYLVTGLAEHGAAVMQYARANAGNYRFTHEVDLERRVGELASSQDMQRASVQAFSWQGAAQRDQEPELTSRRTRWQERVVLVTLFRFLHNCLAVYK